MKRWLLIGGIIAVLGVVGGPFLYFQLVAEDAPSALTIGTGSGTPTVGAPDTLDGTWTATNDSVAGYRVKEILFGQSKEAAGRTKKVTGSFTLNGTTVSAATFTVDMASIESDQDRRDNQFRGRIMDVDTYPTSTFNLTQPIELGTIPDDGVEGTAKATGELTIRGTTKTVTFDLTGRRDGGTIRISGSMLIVFEEWNIPNPSGGPARTSDEGTLEFLLVFTKP
ncbi:MAG TPA: YceI family protein [Actinomycetota bacterium]|nr:YceI family protein [Actinomycetota bacterium]